MKKDAPDSPTPGDSPAPPSPSESISPNTSPSPDAPDETAVADESEPSAGERCQNCGASLHGQYCHFCGQRHVSRLRARELAAHFADSILNVADLRGTLWATLLEGARNPGRLARRYVEGERERFINPVSYILLATTLLFLAYLVFRAELVQAMAEMQRIQLGMMGLNNPEKQLFGPEGIYRKVFGLDSIEAYANQLVSILQQTQTYFLLVYGIITAGILRVTLSNHTFAELAVLMLYAMAQTVLFQVVLLPIFLASSLSFWVMLGIPLQIGILALAGYGFFDDGWKGALLPPLAYIGSHLVILPIFIIIGVGIGVAATTAS